MAVDGGIGVSTLQELADAAEAGDPAPVRQGPRRQRPLRDGHVTTPEVHFEALYRTAGTRVLGSLTRRCDTNEDAADMFGEVVMVAW